MLEQQLIKFSHQPTDLGCNGAIPYTSQGAQLFLQSELDGNLGYSVVDPETLEPISGLYIDDWTEEQIGDYIHVTLGEISSSWSIKEGVCFRIMRMVSSDEEQEDKQYSNVLMYYSNNEGIANVEYWCHEPAFGIPFDDEHHLMVNIPLFLKNPQYKQSDEVYETLDGKSIILYSEMAKEYELKTEYIPEVWHDAIVRILMCDEIRINGLDVYKSGEYSVDWEKHMKSECGTKLAIGSCKVKENVTHRNSN